MFHYFCYIQPHLNKPIIWNCLRVFFKNLHPSIDTQKTVLRFILPENVYTYCACKIIYSKEFTILSILLLISDAMADYIDILHLILENHKLTNITYSNVL